MPERIELSERLFNLTCALLVTKVGLSKQEIFSTVQGYKEQFVSGGDNSALNRMFERDKVLLTESGVIWRSFIPKSAMEDNQEYRYLIATEDFVWPKGTALSAKQVALLNLAAQVWAKASLSADANRALFRIKAIGEIAEDNLIGIAPRVKTHEPAFLPLTTAIESRSRVSFDYRKPEGEEISVRNVEPWSLQNFAGQWLLVAFDLDRDDVRLFLLKRIVSEIDIQDFGYDPPSSEEIDRALRELKAHTQSLQASFRVEPGSEAWFHFQVPEGQDEVTLNYMDEHLFAEELLPFVLDISEIQPTTLADTLRLKLERIASDHA